MNLENATQKLRLPGLAPFLTSRIGTLFPGCFVCTHPIETIEATHPKLNEWCNFEV